MEWGVSTKQTRWHDFHFSSFTLAKHIVKTTEQYNALDKPVTDTSFYLWRHCGVILHGIETKFTSNIYAGMRMPSFALLLLRVVNILRGKKMRQIYAPSGWRVTRRPSGRRVNILWQGRGNYFEVRGGGANVSRTPRQPLLKTKNTLDLAHYFLERVQIHVIAKKNRFFTLTVSPKLGGGAHSQLPSCGVGWGKLTPLPPPPRWFPRHWPLALFFALFELFL